MADPNTALREALDDVVTHRSAWRDAIILARDEASEGSEDPDADRCYWNHELRAFDRTFDALAILTTPAPAPAQSTSSPGLPDAADIGAVLAWAVSGNSPYGTGFMRPVIERLCRAALEGRQP